MGCSISCTRFKSPPPKSNNIRVVGLDGMVEEIGHPITVAEVTGKPGKHFLFTQAQLLAAAATPLKLDASLEPGRVYFLLPTTLFQSNVSPQELAPIARKLASIAHNTPSKSRNITSSPDRDGQGFNRPAKSRSWKPILSTIRERSFNRRSESDLQAEDAKIDDTNEQ